MPPHPADLSQTHRDLPAAGARPGDAGKLPGRARPVPACPQLRPERLHRTHRDERLLPGERRHRPGDLAPGARLRTGPQQRRAAGRDQEALRHAGDQSPASGWPDRRRAGAPLRKRQALSTGDLRAGKGDHARPGAARPANAAGRGALGEPPGGQGRAGGSRGAQAPALQPGSKPHPDPALAEGGQAQRGAPLPGARQGA